MRPGARLHPIFWNHLRVVPSAPMKVKQGKARKVSCAHIEWVCWEARIRAGEITSVVRLEILHANRLRDLPIESLEDLSACRLLVDVAERIEVPVVVIPKRERRWTTAGATPAPGHGSRAAVSAPPYPSSRR